MHPRYNTQAAQSTDGCSTREGYPYRPHPLGLVFQRKSCQNAPALVSRIGPYGYADHVQRPFADPSPSCHSLL